MATCKARRKDGEPCHAEAQAGRPYCFFHDPDRAEARKESKVKGGKAGKLATLPIVKPWRGQPGAVDVLRGVTLAELENLICDTIDDVRTGAIDPRVANAVGYLATAVVKIKQVDALEERLAAIEEALSMRGRL